MAIVEMHAERINICVYRSKCKRYPILLRCEGMNKRRLLTSFKFALEGLIYAFKTQRNLQIHITIGFLVILVAFLLKVSLPEIIILLLTITLVIVCEIVNTAIELSLDVINGEKYHPLVKIIKDVVAASVLLSSINAVIVGSIIFVRYIGKIISKPR